MSDIIDAIDNAISDHAVSPDAMRWTADPDVEVEASNIEALTAEYVARLFDVPVYLLD